MPTGIMTAPMQTKKVGNTPSPRNTSFLEIIGFLLLLISLWHYLAHKKLNTPPQPHCHRLSWTVFCLWNVYLSQQTCFHFTTMTLQIFPAWSQGCLLGGPSQGLPGDLSYDHPSIFLQYSQLCDHEGELHSVSRLLLCFSLLVQYSTNCMGCSTHYYKIGFVWIIFAQL